MSRKQGGRVLRPRAWSLLILAGLAIGVVVLQPPKTLWAHDDHEQNGDHGYNGDHEHHDALDWRRYGNDAANTRFQDVDQISPHNVSQLKPAWVFHTGVLDPKSSFESSPIVVNGTLYVTTGHDDVFALDATNGQKKWDYHALPDMPPLEKISLCCGRDNRGVTYGSGNVYLGRLDDNVVALDATTGAVRWKTAVVDWRDHYSITMAPQFVHGLVIVGVSGGEFLVRGQVIALNAATGSEVWRFYTTEPTTWAGDSWKTAAPPYGRRRHSTISWVSCILRPATPLPT